MSKAMSKQHNRGCSEAEWRLRVELAACYRLLAYYGWDEAIVLPLIERIAGISYTIVDRTFTVSEHLPENWNFVEVMVPIVNEGKTDWTRVRSARKREKEVIKKI